MSDIQFVKIDAQKIIQDIISAFETAYGETLYPSDERRIFLQQLAQIVIGLKNSINDSAKQNLLRYARGEVLNALGKDLYDTERLQAQKATCTGKIVFSTAQATSYIITKGKRVTPDGKLFFVIPQDITIPAGATEYSITLEAAEAGAQFNNYIPGQIKNIVDPIPYVASIVNTSTSSGGSDKESDERYINRCRLSQKSKSTAGPDGAYEYWALSADSTISSVKVHSPSPGVVAVVVLQDNGQIPTQSILDKVYAEVSPKDRRPLTDNVQVQAPTVKTYNIDLTYYLDKEHNAEEQQYRKAIEGENLNLDDGAIRDYINWQQEKLGRDINPDELRFKIQNSASYTSIDNKNYTAVRRIVLSSPTFIEVTDTEVAKVGTITVTYGGLE